MTKEWSEPARQLISLSCNLASRFEQGNERTKRLILETVGSNPVLSDGLLSIDARQPSCTLVQNGGSSYGRGLIEGVRTYFDMDHPRAQQLAETLKEILMREGCLA